MTDTDEQTAELSRRERREAKRAEKTAEKDARKFEDTPAGQARAARQAGDVMFQVAEPLPRTGFAKLNFGSHAPMLQQVEAEGWRLESSSFVYQETGQRSRDKLLSSGQNTQVSGQILGIYLFRAI